jgi:hypothetical protein
MVVQPTHNLTGANMLAKKGDIVELSNGQKAIVISDTYTYRFMDAQDREMVAHGMGEYAGSYGSAFNVVVPSSGKQHRIRCSATKYKVLGRSEGEAA